MQAFCPVSKPTILAPTTTAEPCKSKINTLCTEQNWAYWALWHYHTLGIQDGVCPEMFSGQTQAEPEPTPSKDQDADRDKNRNKAQEQPPAHTLPPSKIPTMNLDIPSSYPDKKTALAALQHTLKQFKELEIAHTAHNMVFADGNPDAEILLVGEAPGAEEDLQGKPFVGASGKLLDAMIASIGLNRTNVYITNVVPWRPPFNRQPSTQEIRACLPFLHQHISIIQPKVIVCVGGVSTKALLNLPLTLTAMQGQVFPCSIPQNDQAIPTWTLYHPAYLMRSPGQKKAAWQQLLCIQAFLKEQGIMPN